MVMLLYFCAESKSFLQRTLILCTN